MSRQFFAHSGSDKHCFAIYVSEKFSCVVGDHIVLQSRDVYTRIISVLRLRSGESVILFNGHDAVEVLLEDATFSSKKIVAVVKEYIDCSVSLQPKLTLIQGITKKAAFEEILYSAAQLGVDTVVPLIVEKSYTGWLNAFEHTRLEKVMISACEQAKQFKLPRLLHVHSIQEIFSLSEWNADHAIKILWDHEGSPFKREVLPILNDKSNEILVLSGPEGGFTLQERTAFAGQGCFIAKLTPTILRSQDAVLLGLGIVRTLTV